MIGVILAAGMARRLRPLTDTRPKCLLTVGERTLLQRTVDAMTGAGIDELVVVTGYRGEMLRSFLSEHYPSLLIHFIDNADYEHITSKKNLLGQFEEHLVTCRSLYLIYKAFIFISRTHVFKRKSRSY